MSRQGRLGRVALCALPASVALGVMLGDTTVSAMQVRRSPDGPATIQVSGDPARGFRWAEVNHPNSPDACPQPSLWFQLGCVARTTN